MQVWGTLPNAFHEMQAPAIGKLVHDPRTESLPRGDKAKRDSSGWEAKRGEERGKKNDTKCDASAFARCVTAPRRAESHLGKAARSCTGSAFHIGLCREGRTSNEPNDDSNSKGTRRSRARRRRPIATAAKPTLTVVLVPRAGGSGRTRRAYRSLAQTGATGI